MRIHAIYGQDDQPGHEPRYPVFSVPQKYADGPAHALVDKLLTYAPMNAEQADRARIITEAAYTYARTLADLCPPSRELTIAIGEIADSRMHANASIAINE